MSADNKLTLNLAKTKEIVFHMPNPKNYLPPAALNGTERDGIAKLLEVWLQNYIVAGKQVENITCFCNQRLYLLSQMRKRSCLMFFKPLSCPVSSMHPLPGMDMHLKHILRAFKSC